MKLKFKIQPYQTSAANINKDQSTNHRSTDDGFTVCRGGLSCHTDTDKSACRKFVNAIDLIWALRF